ncbi:hypothetical protein [Ralstonia sp. UNC404CL21Col]|uniref:hypothetical protein n=1 Tax=Ralstonia sp. UNC404CL21Col TaxID=1380362 RepID=UPI0012DD4583|nr:hypothetical protein [Ralstonia sp. UNC404CL21Col]
MENPAAAPFFTKNGNKTGGLSTTWLKEGVPLGGSKEKGTEIAFRPHFSPVFLLSTRGGKKNAGPQFPATGLPPSPFVLPEPLCFPALCSLLFCSLYCYVPVWPAIRLFPYFPYCYPYFPSALF